MLQLTFSAHTVIAVKRLREYIILSGFKIFLKIKTLMKKKDERINMVIFYQVFI